VIDEISQEIVIALLKTKTAADVYRVCKKIQLSISARTGNKLLTWQFDRGTEFLNSTFEQWLKMELGVTQRFSNIEHPWENGKAERSFQTLFALARSLLKHADLPDKLWGKATLHSVYLMNRSPTAALGGIAPLQFRTKEKIDLSHMRVFGCPAQIFVRATIRDDKKHLIEHTNKKKATKKIISNINYDPVRIRELVFLLSDDRATNYNQWLELGWALHNIDPNSQELLDIWIDFSKKSSKFKDGECEKIWEKSKNEGLTIACIHYWAKIDNKKKYDEYKDKDIGKWIDLSIKTQSNYDIAFVLFKMYEYDFVFSDNDWYIYKNHLWHRENDGMSLRQKISNDLCKNYAKLISLRNASTNSTRLPADNRSIFFIFCITFDYKLYYELHI
jgi:hypothetical protein